MRQSLNDNMSTVFAIDGMKPSDQNQKATDTTITYFGFVNSKGEWYIMQQVATNSGADLTFKYIKGNSGYTANYALRESLTYDYFYNIFT